MNEVVQLKDIVNLRRETVQPNDSNKRLNFVGLKHIDSGVSTLKRWGDASEVKSVKSRFYPDDVLYGKLRPYLDKAIIAEIEGICSSDILVLTVNSKVIPRFLVYLLHSHTFRSYAVSTSSGITLPRTSWNTLGKFTLTLPPLAEQRRIVAKLEVLFTQLDAAVDSLKKAQVQLHRYRRSILKAAFEGELTREWREGYSGELEPMAVSEISTLEGLPKLPDGWMWRTLEEISEIILGQSPPSSTYNTDGEGLPFYQGKLEFGELYPTPRKWCTAPKKIAEKGDVFISIRAPVGPTNLCPEKSAVGRGLAAIRGLNGIQPFFILYLLRRFENEIANKGTGTTFNAITGNQLKAFQIPLPPLVEQEQIVSEIDRHLSVADEAETTIGAELKRAECLRQSILKHAFSGKLVPQDPNDEPAEMLLARIKAEH